MAKGNTKPVSEESKQKRRNTYKEKRSKTREKIKLLCDEIIRIREDYFIKEKRYPKRGLYKKGILAFYDYLFHIQFKTFASKLSSNKSYFYNCGRYILSENVSEFDEWKNVTYEKNNKTSYLYMNLADICIFFDIDYEVISDRIKYALDNKLINKTKKTAIIDYNLTKAYKNKDIDFCNIFIATNIFPTLFCKNTLYEDKELWLKKNVIEHASYLNKIINEAGNYQFIRKEIKQYYEKMNSLNKELRYGKFEVPSEKCNWNEIELF